MIRSFTAGAVRTFFRPAGLSGLQMTKDGTKPFATRVSSIIAANQGLPKKANCINF